MEITKKLSIFVIVGAFILILLFFVFEADGYYTPDTDKSLTVSQGDTFTLITGKLKTEKVINSELIFRIYTRLFHSENISKVRPGNYEFSGKQSYKEIMSSFVKGPDTEKITVTIPEGYELREIAALMENKGLCKASDFIEAANKDIYTFKYNDELKNTENRLEGFLFPDTYIFEKESATPELIIKTMLKRFEEIYAEYEEIQTDFSVFEIVTLASVIEREAMYEADFYKVSSVFNNRLKRDDHLSYLQSCATVQYILKERKSVLSIADTKIDSPYNTYKYPGLPKGPIASPGALAIEAALKPDNSNYLYFLNDKDGKLHFSQTLSEHNAKVNKYVN